MSRIPTGLTSIDCFLWTPGDNQLAYFDKDGNYIERPIPPGLLDDAIRFFDGHPKAIQRSTGGLVLAHPIEVVVCCPKEGTGSISEVKIKMKFSDLKRDENGIIQPKPISHTKLVAATEIHEPFNVEMSLDKYFAVDFGQGLIPIVLFGTEVEEKGIPWVYFVRQDELEAGSRESRGGFFHVQIYKVPRAILRFLPGAISSSAERTIPECLCVGSPAQLPTGASIEINQHLLRLNVDPETRQYADVLFRKIRAVDEEDLLPFGLFE